MLRKDVYEKVQRCLLDNGFDGLLPEELYEGQGEFDYQKEEIDLWYTAESLRWRTRGNYAMASSSRCLELFPDWEFIGHLGEIFLGTGDEDLRKVYWNTFAEVIHRCSTVDAAKALSVYDEVERAVKDYYEISGLSNHTPVFDTERLTIAPQNREHSHHFRDYIRENEKDPYHNPMVSPFILSTTDYSNPHSLLFNAFLKGTDTLVANIGVYTLNREPKIGHFQYYTKIEHRGKGYAAEAVSALVDMIRRGQVLQFGEFNYRYISEERVLDPDALSIETSEENIASQKIAQRLGFEYTGTIPHKPNFRGDIDKEVVYRLALKR